MRINQNIAALNAYRRFSMTNNLLNKTLERLSSGLRINRAADDAAGLSISEKMRGQIRGLNQAMRNAQDAVSLIQTAEGALSEAHAVLQRMRELSIQAANDTLTAMERVEIQKEINQLGAEIDRVAGMTEFNSKKLLDGSTAALSSTDNLQTRVLLRGGLHPTDSLSNNTSAAGNYKLEITSDPGVSHVQKSGIMKLKHQGGSVAVETVRAGVPTQNSIYRLTFRDEANFVNERGLFKLDLWNEEGVHLRTEIIDYSEDPALLISRVEAALAALPGYSADDFIVWVDSSGRLTVEFTGALAGKAFDMAFYRVSIPEFYWISHVFHAEGGAGAVGTIYDLQLTADGGTYNLTITFKGNNYLVDGIGYALTGSDLADYINNHGVLAGTNLQNNFSVAADRTITFDVAGSGDIITVMIDGSNLTTDPPGGATSATALQTQPGIQGDNMEVDFRLHNVVSGHYRLIFDQGGAREFITDPLFRMNASPEEVLQRLHTSSPYTEDDFIVTAISNDIIVGDDISNHYQGWKFQTAGDLANVAVVGIQFHSHASIPLGRSSEEIIVVGSQGVSEIQQINFHDVKGGSFKLSFDTVEIQTLNLDNPNGGSYIMGGPAGTVSVVHDAGALELQEVLESLYGQGHVTVASAAEGFKISFFDLGEPSGLFFNGSGLTNAINPALTLQQSWARNTTAALPYPASADDVQAELELLPNIGQGNVIVKQDNNFNYTVYFIEDLATQKCSKLIINKDNLRGLGDIGDIAGRGSALYDIDRFWDAQGNFLMEDPQTITLVQGDGRTATVTIFGTDTIGEIETKLNQAIHEGLNQKAFTAGNPSIPNYASYVTTEDAQNGGLFSVPGTFVLQSGLIGKDGAINFIGTEQLISALGLSSVRSAAESRYSITISDAHSGELVADKINLYGNKLQGIIHPEVDILFDPMAATRFVNNDGIFDWQQASGSYTTYVHLADSAMVFHIGANPLQNMVAAIRNMGTEALGIHNILITDRLSTNLAISRLEKAIEGVSSERARLGAMQKRLEHTLNNLGTSSENLANAESRIRDLDYYKEIAAFTRHSIMSQAGTAMLAQANLKPQEILALLV